MVFKNLAKVFVLNIFYFTQIVHTREKGDEEYHHCLLEENSYSFGFGMPYSFELFSARFNTRVYRNTGENICFGPEFS